ncbi:hypothetical protein LB505_011672 [Fusarium chuoi]|nr:hypothetical protein LB505_011672 [Fusarium chuoi]
MDDYKPKQSMDEQVGDTVLSSDLKDSEGYKPRLTPHTMATSSSPRMAILRYLCCSPLRMGRPSPCPILLPRHRCSYSSLVRRCYDL